jgi:hypothetical protein
MRVGISIATSIATAGQSLTMQQGFMFAGANGFLAGAGQSHSLKGAAWAALSAMAFHGIGQFFETANWAMAGRHVFGTNLNLGGFAAKVLSHGIAGGAVQHMQGGKFGSGFAAAGVTQAFSGAVGKIDPTNPYIGSAARILTAAMIGGVASDLSGGKFAHGAVTAAFSQAFGEVGRTAYQSTGPEIGLSVDPTPDAADEERLQTYYEAMAAANPSGIELGKGTKVIYVDSYAYFKDGTLTYCSANCDSALERYGMVSGKFDGAANRITLYRSAVEPQWISGQSGHTIWAKPLTRTGVESAIWTLGHEAAHSRGIDRNIGGRAFHRNAELAGEGALERYRAWRSKQ